MVEYRKRKGSDTWHWCKNCSNWPTSDYDVIYTKPITGELDNECRAKEKEGKCIKQNGDIALVLINLSDIRILFFKHGR